MESLDTKKYEVEYQKIEGNLNRFRHALLKEFEQLLKNEKVSLGFPIQNRTKSLSSIFDKIESKRFRIKESIGELQDLVGIRIILLFKRDIKKVCKIIETNLSVINKYDTLEKLKEDQFGYSSIHFIVTIPEEWSKVPTFFDLKNFVAEIQIRTLSQHNWAEVSQELQYKQEKSVPRQLIRSIGRVSALLETVDLEFERLLSQRDEYIYNIDKELKSTKNTPLDVDLLEIITDRALPSENKMPTESYSELLEELRNFGINMKQDLENLISEQLRNASEQDKKRVKEIELDSDVNKKSMNKIANDRVMKGVFFTHVGLIRLMLQNKFPENWEKHIMKKIKI